MACPHILGPGAVSLLSLLSHYIPGPRYCDRAREEVPVHIGSASSSLSPVRIHYFPIFCIREIFPDSHIHRMESEKGIRVQWILYHQFLFLEKYRLSNIDLNRQISIPEESIELSVEGHRQRRPWTE